MKKQIGVVLALTTLLASLMVGSYAAVKTGAACKVAGQSQVVQGKKYLCVKSGKKLVWGKGVLVSAPKPTVKATPTPTPSASPTQTPSASPTVTPTPTPSATPAPIVDPLSECKLSVLDGRGDVAIGGWPRISARSKTTGVVNATVVMVDFPDAPAKMTPQDAFAKIEGATDVFTEVSYGSLQYSFKPQFKWYRMSKESKSYAPLNKSFATHREYIAEAIALADGDVDFSKTDNIIVLANPDATGIGNSGPAFAALGPYGITVDGNTIMNGATSSHDLNYWKSIWLNHEITHAMGLPDLYAFTTSNSANPYDGFRYTGEFSYMGLSSYESNSPSLFAFERWNLGWIDDSQVVCSKAVGQKHTITAVEVKGGLKAVLIPLDFSRALVVESRRAVGLDKKMSKVGAVVYLVDSAIQSGRGPIQVYPINLAGDPRYLSAPRAVGEKVSVEGYTITVVAADATTDTIEISKG